MGGDLRILLFVLLAALACMPAPAQAASPTGWDAYRRLDLLPMLRPAEQAHLASSFDRRGANRDGSYACRRHVGGRCVVAEHTGPGEIDSIWSTRPRAGDVRGTGTIRVELDGGTVLDAPLADVVAGRLGAPFAYPAVASARQASGAVWIKVPMAFRERMRITTSRDPRYVRVNYRTFDSTEGVATFDPDDRAADGLGVLRRRGQPDGIPGEPVGGGGAQLVVTGPGTLAEVNVAPRSPLTGAERITMRFDGRQTVSARLAELSGSGLPASVHSVMAWQTRETVALRWPMPFRERAEISVTGVPADVSGAIDRASPLPDALARDEAGYFHAASRRGGTVRGRPWKVLEVDGAGLLVGVSATLAGPRSQRHLEGDETIVADGVALRGTGTEDFFEGGFYWYHGPRTLPLVGSPAHLVRRRGCVADCRSMYRWLVADAVPFSRSLRLTLEHGDRNRVAATYSTTAVWYAP